MKFTKAAKEAYCFALAEYGTHLRASETVGIHFTTSQAHRSPTSPYYDPEFVAACEQAIETFTAMLVEAATQRAVKGWREPMIGGKNKDRVVAYRPMFSDRLLELMLKRHDPNYRERVTVDQNTRVEHVHKLDLETLSPDERELVRQLLDAKAKAMLPAPIIDVTPNAVTIKEDSE